MNRSSWKRLSGRLPDRGSGAGVALLAGALLLSVAACGGSGIDVRYQRDNLSEERYAPDGSKYEVLGVVPFNTEEYDPQIAGRVRRKLTGRGYTAEMYLVQSGGNPSPKMVMETVCPSSADSDTTKASGQRPEKVLAGIDGVVFVTWNHLVLRDCETHGVAYEVDGGYSGVEKMLDWMERYFEGKPAPGD